ncbi:DUF418 domain-containing protein [Pseudonocardia sp. ICBG601]|uniref:DUF418 domain-containing protein n=1 Tax=Pseudonocardia sp. ICBG601 TaxID=2846759 RepID=UPI0027E34E95|nr:DUF418 domain-containing protein [Pseudonocardia sp. ICBG601]
MTCYVGQNVVAAVLFGAWGLGLAGALVGVPAPLRTGVVVAVWALVVAGSPRRRGGGCAATTAARWRRSPTPCSERVWKF